MVCSPDGRQSIKMEKYMKEIQRLNEAPTRDPRTEGRATLEDRGKGYPGQREGLPWSCTEGRATLELPLLESYG